MIINLIFVQFLLNLVFARTLNVENSKTAKQIIAELNDCFEEPLNRYQTKDSKCKNIKHDLIIKQLNDKEKQHSKCLQSYLDKLIIFKQSPTLDLLKEKETIQQKEECVKEIKAEQSTIVKFLRNALNECLEEPLSQMNDNDSKCKNINETVVNALNSVDNKLYSSCLQSYIVNIGETNFGGHYVIWKQKSDTLGWIKISSYPTKSYANLVKNFQNVYLLFLERFKVV